MKAHTAAECRAVWAEWEWECSLKFQTMDFKFQIKEKTPFGFERSLFFVGNAKYFRRIKFYVIISPSRGNKNMETLVLEGTWEEIAKHEKEFNGRRLRVTVIDEEQKPEPNQKMREIMKLVKEKQKNMRFTDGSKTQEMLRAARSGGMFDGELDE